MAASGSALVHNAADVLMTLLMDERAQQFNQRAIAGIGAVEGDAVELVALLINELVRGVIPPRGFLTLQPQHGGRQLHLGRFGDEEAAAKARKAEQQQPPAMGHGSVEKVLRVPKHLKRSVAATKAEAKMDPSSKKAARAKRKPLKRQLRHFEHSC